MDTNENALSDERADLLAMLAKHRHFLRYTTRDLTDEQISRRTTVSELCLGGLIKHVAMSERQWIDFILKGPSAWRNFNEPSAEDLAVFTSTFQVVAGETLTGLLAGYAEVARRTDEVVAALPDLGARQPLPRAPWFEPGETWSARRVLMHIIAETAQHAGHADIIRESLDGAKTMA